MDNIGYALSDKFIIVAVDTNFKTTVGSVLINKTNTKKVYLLNEQLIISVIGEGFKATDIYKYILTLNELGENESFDETVENLKSVFGLSAFNSQAFSSLNKVLQNFANSQGEVEPNEVLESLSSKPDLRALLKDTLELQRSNLNYPTNLFLFGTDYEPFRIRMGSYIIFGNHMIGNDIIFEPGKIFMGFSSAIKSPTETQQLAQELIDEINSFITPDWQESNEQMEIIISTSKELLRRGLKQISSFDEKVEVIFYELSKLTKFKFSEPAINLTPIMFSRSES